MTFAIYLVATGIALVAPYVALAINIAVRVHLLRIRYRLAPSLPTAVRELTPQRECSLAPYPTIGASR